MHAPTLDFVRYLIRGYKWRLSLILMLGCAIIGTSLLFVWLSKQVIDIATGMEYGDWRIYAFYVVITLGVQALIRLFNISLTNKTALLMGNTVRLKVFSHLLYTRWQSLSQIHSGDMLTRIIKDTDDVVQLLTVSTPSAIIAVIQLVASLAMLYVFSPMLAITLGIGMPLVLVFSRLFYRRMLGYSDQIKRCESKINAHMQESLGNQTVIRTFERQETEIDKLRLFQGQLFSAVRRRVGFTVYANTMVSGAFNGGYIIAFVWGVYGLIHKTITFGVMNSFLQLVTRIQRPLADLMSLVPGMISAKSGIDRLVNVLEYQTEYTGRSPHFSGDIVLEIKNMDFQYDDGESLIFQGFNLRITSGQMVAVMGATGTGKTTLLRLLLGLIRPISGSIKVSSLGRRVEVSEATRSNFVYVPQGNSLFSGSIRDNLLVGDAEADDRRLRQVLRIAEADFAWELPDGLDTMLGEKGTRLSEGQAQRIAIARSLLRPGRILLLDEATSALDTETEERFLINLRRHIHDRIVLFITHHDSVARACDQVVRI